MKEHNDLVTARIWIDSLDRCRAFGRALGRVLVPGDTVLLSGDLGAGKTTLAGFIVQGLGVGPEYVVTSPSFALMHEYPGRCPVYHMDCYRLTGEEDVEAAGLSEYLESRSGVCLVEWPRRLGRLVPRASLLIRLESGDGEQRTLTLSGPAPNWRDRLARLCPHLTRPLSGI